LEPPLGFGIRFSTKFRHQSFDSFILVGRPFFELFLILLLILGLLLLRYFLRLALDCVQGRHMGLELLKAGGVLLGQFLNISFGANVTERLSADAVQPTD